MNKLTAEKCRMQFEEWYSKMKGTPLSVLMTLRDGENYKETDGERLDISWLAWQASRQALEIALPILEQQERGEGWIEWEGREIPGAVKGRVVQVRYATGEIETEYSGFLNWGNGSGKPVCAYRIIPEQPTNQNGEQ